MEKVKRINSQKELEELKRYILERTDPKQPVISICVGTGCVARGAKEVSKALKKELEKQGLKKKVKIKETGCLNFCEQGPSLMIHPQRICYFKVKPEDAEEIISKTLIENKVIDRLLYKDPKTGRQIKSLGNIPFFSQQHMLLLGDNAEMDPKNIEDYIALDGYSSLAKALFEMTPQNIIEEVKKSNLRGRGGGGFPTGIKWETTRRAKDETKYVIANCDEGDPGAFADRTLMEGNPHMVLEGLIIGAYAIGANEGYIYIRNEYPMAIENISIAIKQAEEYGLLGDNIIGSNLNFHVKVHRGAGAFVSGESSALINAIEGKVGEPRPKYIHTTVKGLWNKPTCINNVKTWAFIPLIILRGAAWFRKIGTKNSSGTMIFSLVGKVNNTGLVEVPMGITLRDLIFEIGGGIRNEKKFKTVQTGGPSGGFIPEQHLDVPVDFDQLTKLGSIMGSGGMVIMDEDTCMVNVARYFVDFLLEESCGKCIPCREGLRALSGILKNICEGKGEEEDFELIQDICETMKETSLCALGQTAVNPVLTSMKYFKNEWEQHVIEKKCTAKQCKALMNYYIDPKLCQACLICLQECPVGAIVGDKDQVHWIDQEKCIKCGICYEFCKFDAIKKLSGEPIVFQPIKIMKPICKRK